MSFCLLLNNEYAQCNKKSSCSECIMKTPGEGVEQGKPLIQQSHLFRFHKVPSTKSIIRIKGHPCKYCMIVLFAHSSPDKHRTQANLYHYQNTEACAEFFHQWHIPFFRDLRGGRGQNRIRSILHASIIIEHITYI